MNRPVHDGGRGYSRAAWLPAIVRARLRTVVEHLPPLARNTLLRWGGVEPPRRVRWGSLRRPIPFSRSWGYDRGTPIDRRYIETFLAEHVADVQGDCLEVLDAVYTRRFGRQNVDRADVLDINPENPQATVFADLGEPDSLPADRYDCFVLTQTLHLIPDMRVALANAWRTLRPGGVLLVTVPALGRHEAREGYDHDRWRLTPAGLSWLLDHLDGVDYRMRVYGNVLTAAAFLYGMAAEELRPADFAATDPEFPMIVAARVRKPAAS